MVVPVIHDVFTITHQVSINYITLNPVVRVGLREDSVSVIPGSLTNNNRIRATFIPINRLKIFSSSTRVGEGIVLSLTACGWP